MVDDGAAKVSDSGLDRAGVGREQLRFRLVSGILDQRANSTCRGLGVIGNPCGACTGSDCQYLLRVVLELMHRDQTQRFRLRKVVVLVQLFSEGLKSTAVRNIGLSRL